MVVSMELRVARMVESMQWEKYRRDPTIYWRQVLSCAESSGEASSEAGSSHIEGSSKCEELQRILEKRLRCRLCPDFVNVTAH